MRPMGDGGRPGSPAACPTLGATRRAFATTLLAAITAICATAALAVGAAPTAIANEHQASGAGSAGGGRTSMELRATYDVVARLGLATGRIRVRSSMDVLNTSGGAVDRLELNTIAVARGGISHLSATVDGRTVGVGTTGQTLLVPLPGGLRDGERTRVTIGYRARFRASTAGHDWLWSRSNGIISAYRWIPWISRRVSFSRPNFGDPFVTPVSPRVRVALTTDRPADFATSGRRIAKEGLRQTFVADDVRDFNFTVSARYRTLTGRSRDSDTQLRILTRTGNASGLLAWGRRALGRYESLIGEYPYPTFTIAESSGGFAMESPALIWIPYGAPSSAGMPYLVAHETAHQWFYAAVGNDQSDKPFADEALADLLARTLLDQWRASRCAKSRLDLTIYQYSRACYYEVVYVQGSRFLDAMRRKMGDARFWRALGGYYRENRFKLSSTRRLLEALRAAATYDPLASYRQRFPRYY
jgi:hypothetical protein